MEISFPDRPGQCSETVIFVLVTNHRIFPQGEARAAKYAIGSGEGSSRAADPGQMLYMYSDPHETVAYAST